MVPILLYIQMFQIDLLNLNDHPIVEDGHMYKLETIDGNPVKRAE